MICETVLINATPAEIFQWWDDTESWPVWNELVRETHLPAGFCSGSEGWISLPWGRRFKIRISRVQYLRSFEIVLRYHIGSVIIESYLMIKRGRTEVLIRGHYVGIFAPILKRLVHNHIQNFIRSTLIDLKKTAEEGCTKDVSTISGVDFLPEHKSPLIG